MSKKEEKNLKPCSYHSDVLVDVDDFVGCSSCLEEYSKLKHPDDMIGEEREKELNHWLGPMWIPFDLIHKRIGLLVGRPVWTHEMRLSNIDKLLVEARDRQRCYDGNPEQAEQRMIDSIPDREKGKFILYDPTTGEVESL